MAFFLYKDIKNNRNKPGVWLRVNAMLKHRDFVDAMREAHVEHCPSLGSIERIKIDSIEAGCAILQVWARSRKVDWPVALKGHQGFPKAVLDRKAIAMDSYRVVIVHMPENPEWVCESDCGRGYVEGRRKG